MPPMAGGFLKLNSSELSLASLMILWPSASVLVILAWI